MTLKLKVINLFAAPGVGKSTTAAALFNLMKTKGMSVELVTEFAKEVVYERNYGSLQNQLAILAEQDKRLRRLEGQSEWAITDSPLPLSLIYMTPEYEAWLTPAVWGAYDRYVNFDVFLARDPLRTYSTQGRTQSLEESVALDSRIHKLFKTASHEEGLHAGMGVGAPYNILQWALAE